MSLPRDNRPDPSTKLLRAICSFILFGMLVAGLWPFHAPRNAVSWLSGDNGLLFGKHGSIVSASPFQTLTGEEDKACSLEIWLEPSRIGSDAGGMILAFYLPEKRVIPFALRQFQAGLVLEHESQDSPISKNEIYVDDVFGTMKPVLVTITSSAAGTAIYADGALLKKVPKFVISNRDLTGQFVVGNGPTTADSWSGQLKGLAIYARELPSADVSQGFVDWTNSGQPNLAKSRAVVARYRFDERTGNIVRNQVASTTNLVIPERFFVLHQQFLERPLDEFRPGWRYWKNIAVNVVGFIPLGFSFYPYFWLVRRTDHPAAVTIACGFAVSLTIEVLQAFLPTRDSGMTDLITNTLGSAVGVMAFKYKAVQSALAAARVHAAKPTDSLVPD